MRRLAGLALLLAVALCACGSVAIVDDGDASPAADADAAELAAHAGDALEVRDAGAECPPVGLSCGSVRGACAQGQVMAQQSNCGGPRFAVCCPAADCELAACEPCPNCP